MTRAAAHLPGLLFTLFAGSAFGNGIEHRGDYRFELTPSGGFAVGGTFTDESTGEELDLDDSGVVGIQLNIRADPQTSYEIHFARQNTSASTSTVAPVDVVVEKLEIGGTYETSVSPTRPFVAATVGLSRVKPDEFADDTFFSFSLGGGVKFFTDRRLGLTIDARWVAALVDEDSDVFCLSDGGLTCLIQAEANLLSQFRVFAGFNLRF